MSGSSDNTLETRVIVDPNGKEYIVAIEKACWSAFDWIAQNDAFTEIDLIHGAWYAAKQTENDGTMHNPGNFHAEFRDAFRYMVSVRLSKIESRAEGLANDNSK